MYLELEELSCMRREDYIARHIIIIVSMYHFFSFVVCMPSYRPILVCSNE